MSFPTVTEQKLPFFQRRMLRPSRALPYQLAADENLHIKKGKLELHFINTGTQGAVFHLYNKLHLDKITRRYTIEADKAVTDE